VESKPAVDIDLLLAPIAGANPSGENLRYGGLHDLIREARRADDGLEQGAWQREVKTSDWPRVESLATEALGAKTKDLQVCAWLVEALVKLHGFAGLRDGLRTTRGLMEQFWDTLYPEIDEGDLEARVNAVSFIDRYAGIAIKEALITGNPVGANYSYLQFEDSRKFDIPENADTLVGEELDRITEIRARAEAENKITSEKWRVAKNASNRAFYEGTHAILNQCWDEYSSLDRLMDEKFGRQAPGMAVLKKSLQEIRDLVERLVKEKRILEPDEVAAEEGEPGAGAQQIAPGAALVVSGPLRSRQEALKRLAEVSEYFRQTEPHSPVSYLVQRAIRWGQMPLESWLDDVIKDVNVLAQLRETLGIKPPE
jgi:type VI secretion system protein ImpA